MRIVELDGYAANPGDLTYDGIKELGEFTVYPRTAPEEVVERAKDAEIVLINKVNMTAEVIAQLPKLKYIGVMATGYNVVDLEAATEHGVVVTNIPAYSTDSVAQMTFALMLNMSNRVAHYANKNRNGRWSEIPDFCYWDTPLAEIAGKSLGIVGLGNIGMRVARIALEFGMEVYAYTSKPANTLPDFIHKTTWEGLLSESDILSLHCPLSEKSHHLINKESIAKMKDGAIILNTARGPLVNEQDVAEALESGKLLYYGADVMEEEPPRADNPLLAQKHAFITPHIAWATKEARTRLLKTCEANIRAFIEGNPINVVNK